MVVIRRRARGIVLGKKHDNEFGLDSRTIRQEPTGQASGLATDSAKGLIQGAQMSNQQDSTSQNILMLLQKISDQLDSMKASGQVQAVNPNCQQPNGVVQQESQGQNGLQMQGSQQNEIVVSEQLQQLFSQLLQSKSQQGTQNNQNKEQPSQQPQNKSASVAVQTAAQVLAQAQYELSNELETSLKKLKQVISESEKIANKISNLLGEENNNQQSR